MAKFKGRISCKQYMINKAIKWFLSGGVDAAAKDICMNLIFILEKRTKVELGLGKTIVLDLYKTHIVCFILTTLILQH